MWIFSYRILGKDISQKLYSIDLENEDNKIYEKGFKLFQERRFQESIDYYDKIGTKTSEYLRVLVVLYEEFDRNGKLPKNWDGFVKLSKDGNPESLLWLISLFDFVGTRI